MKGVHYEQLQHRKSPEFLRRTGVRHDTFEAMLSALIEHTRNFGRPPKLLLCD